MKFFWLVVLIIALGGHVFLNLAEIKKLEHRIEQMEQVL